MKTWYSIRAQAGMTAAEISVHAEIGMWGINAAQFIRDLKQITAESITLTINSPGGSVFDALAMFNALRGFKKPVNVKVLGIAASAASVLALAGDTIEMPDNTMMMIHKPLIGLYGNADELRDTADTLDSVENGLQRIYMSRWKGTEEELTQALRDETYLTAAECLERGLCDVVSPSIEVKASFDVENLPENVRALFESARPNPEPVALKAPMADQVREAAESAGMVEFAASWALKFTDMADVQAAIGNAREVKALCGLAGKPGLAAALITAAKPLAEVRDDLTAALEADAEKTHVSTAAKRSSAPSPLQINPAEVYAKANQFVKRA